MMCYVAEVWCSKGTGFERFAATTPEGAIELANPSHGDSVAIYRRRERSLDRAVFSTPGCRGSVPVAAGMWDSTRHAIVPRFPLTGTPFGGGK